MGGEKYVSIPENVNGRDLNTFEYDPRGSTKIYDRQKAQEIASALIRAFPNEEIEKIVNHVLEGKSPELELPIEAVPAILKYAADELLLAAPYGRVTDPERVAKAYVALALTGGVSADGIADIGVYKTTQEGAQKLYLRLLHESGWNYNILTRKDSDPVKRNKISGLAEQIISKLLENGYSWAQEHHKTDKGIEVVKIVEISANMSPAYNILDKKRNQIMNE